MADGDAKSVNMHILYELFIILCLYQTLSLSGGLISNHMYCCFNAQAYQGSLQGLTVRGDPNTSHFCLVLSCQEARVNNCDLKICEVYICIVRWTRCTSAAVQLTLRLRSLFTTVDWYRVLITADATLIHPSTPL